MLAFDLGRKSPVHRDERPVDGSLAQDARPLPGVGQPVGLLVDRQIGELLPRQVDGRLPGPQINAAKTVTRDGSGGNWTRMRQVRPCWIATGPEQGHLDG